MIIYKQWFNSYGDKLFNDYFISKEKAMKYRETLPNVKDCTVTIKKYIHKKCYWEIEEIEVQEWVI